MAHPPDPALTCAVGEAIKVLRDDGWSTRGIAEKFDVADPTVIRWENGKRAPELRQLPLLDEMCGQPRGYVLRVAGYVVDDIDIEAALGSDPAIPDPDDRAMIVRFYRHMRAASKNLAG
jgi:transcriptional regulator with XRE-family HTH domain